MLLHCEKSIRHRLKNGKIGAEQELETEKDGAFPFGRPTFSGKMGLIEL